MDFFEQLKQGRYGAFELNRQVGRNLVRGFAFAVVFHAAVIATPAIYEILVGQVEPVRVVPYDPTARPIPPPLRPVDEQSPKLNQIIQEPEPVLTDVVKLVPVPEDSIGEDQPKLATNDELKEFYGKQPGGDTSGAVGIGGSGEVALLDTGVSDSVIFTPFEYPPEALPDFRPNPEYPHMAKVAGIEGKVVVWVYVDKKGNVRKHKFASVNPENLGFDEAVSSVIDKWRFTPAIQNKEPVGVWVAIPFKFKLAK